MIRKAFLMTLAVGFLLAGCWAALAEDKPCPWRISQVGVGKWANGSYKAGIWVKGSFPVNIPGVTERPTWFVNGTEVGKSQINIGQRFIPNASHLLNTGSNTIKVVFLKPPYNGASDTKTITGFDWKDVPNGGYKYYMAR